MDSRYIQALFVSSANPGNNLIQIQISSIHDFRCRISGQHHFFWHQRTSIQHQRTLANQALAFHRN